LWRSTQCSNYRYDWMMMFFFDDRTAMLNLLFNEQATCFRSIWALQLVYLYLDVQQQDLWPRLQVLNSGHGMSWPHDQCIPVFPLLFSFLLCVLWPSRVLIDTFGIKLITDAGALLTFGWGLYGQVLWSGRCLAVNESLLGFSIFWK